MSKKQAKLLLIILNIILVITIAAFIFVLTIYSKDDSKEAVSALNQDITEQNEETSQTTQITTTEEPTESPEEAEKREISEYIADMTLEEKVGQMFFIRADASFDQTFFDTYHPGGIILFGKDVDGKTASGLADYIEGFQDCSRLPLFIGIDEEGGTVSRISSNSNLVASPFQSPRSLYEEGGYEAVIEDSHYKSSLLKSFGINVNFAPVVDYSVNYGEFMYSRAFGSSINETCEFADKIVTAMKEDKMGSVLKHFPGYGNNGDTHTNIITDYRDFETFENQDFLPFASGIDAGADAVLVSHNIVVSMDEQYPASLSEKVHDILRNNLGFEGVIITDDLAMSGVADFVDGDTAAVQAVKAGNDMILVSDYQNQYEAVIAAVRNGDIDEKILDEAVARILKWKYNLGLMP